MRSIRKAVAIGCVVLTTIGQRVNSFPTHIKSQALLNPRFTNNFSNNHLRPYLASQKSTPPSTEKEHIFKQAVDVYIDYASRLWKETSEEARNLIAKKKATSAIQNVQNILEGEGMDSGKTLEAVEARHALLDSCGRMLDVLRDENGKKETVTEVGTANETAVVEEQPPEPEPPTELTESTPTSVLKPIKRAKPRRSILLGATMGLCVACWVFSGNYIFTSLFTLMTILGQLEYYRMVIQAGIYPARTIAVLGACAMFLTALIAPELHQVVLPGFATIAMVFFLMGRGKVSTIAEIATTFTGMFYLGYMPSFWVRLRVLGGGREPTRLAPVAAPLLRSFGSKIPDWFPKGAVVHLPITTGAVFIFWTWLCIAFSDVGAYFAGRYFGRTKLGTVSPAAGQTSPNKTMEGVVGGVVISAALATLGAWVQKWPFFWVTGPVHGAYLALLGLVGDLTASMLKRDAGIKDYGDLIPEHGGILDRTDSFIFTAPYSWLVCAFILPFLKRFA